MSIGCTPINMLGSMLGLKADLRLGLLPVAAAPIIAAAPPTPAADDDDDNEEEEDDDNASEDGVADAMPTGMPTGDGPAEGLAPPRKRLISSCRALALALRVAHHKQNRRRQRQ